MRIDRNRLKTIMFTLRKLVARRWELCQFLMRCLE